jgi:PAS domain S-box-containing protein
MASQTREAVSSSAPRPPRRSSARQKASDRAGAADQRRADDLVAAAAEDRADGPAGATENARARRGERVGAPGLRALVDGGEEAMLLADERGNIVFANVAAGLLLGRPPDELIGKLGFDFCRADDLPIAREAYGRCLEGPLQSASCTVRAVDPGGRAKTVAVRLVNHLDSRGVGAVVVHFREVIPGPDTSAQPYRTLFERALIGLGVADLQGNLLDFNDEMLKPGGYTRDDILRIGNVSRLYALDSDRSRVLEILMTKGIVWREEVPFLRKDGSTYDTLLSLTPVRFRGRPCLYAMVEDITERNRIERERRKLEGQLSQARKMEAVGQMTAGIAHDFNNLLEVIVSSADLAAHSLGTDDGAAVDYLADVREHALGARDMIRKLMGYSRTASLDVAPTDVGALLLRMEEMLHRMLPEGVSLELGPMERVTALCDPHAVEEMVLNLVSNARDAMPEGGTVRLVVERYSRSERMARPRWLPDDDFVRLSVVDTGVGMDRATLAHAMEPFFTTKSVGAGTGLGLSMVFGLAKQQGGYLDLLSRVGEGTTARVYLRSAGEDDG